MSPPKKEPQKGEEKPGRTRRSPTVRPLNPIFRMTFLCVVLLTFASLVASIVLTFAPPTDYTYPFMAEE